MSERQQGMAGKDGGDLTQKTDLPKLITRHSSLFRLGFTVCMAAIFVGFISLSVWQVKRLQWKLDLIERVEQRVHAAPIPAPAFSQWPQINASADEYRHVQVTGKFLYAKTTLVQASTELGGGFWLITPLVLADQSVILINRGFIPEKLADSYRTSSKEDRSVLLNVNPAQVIGLLRMTEPGGGFLRKNDPAGNRWFSRDVQAIAAAHDLINVAPFFIDAEATSAPAQDSLSAQGNTGSNNYPVAGLTVIHFNNNHVVYAVVWFLLAVMTAAAWLYVISDRKYQRRHQSEINIPEHSDI